MNPTLADSLRILDISPGASTEEVQQAFRVQMKKWHPDNYHSVPQEMLAVAAKKSAEINAAYACIQAELNQREKLQALAPEPARDKRGGPSHAPTPDKEKTDEQRYAENRLQQYKEGLARRIYGCSLDALCDFCTARIEECFATMEEIRICNAEASRHHQRDELREKTLIAAKIARRYVAEILAREPSYAAALGSTTKVDLFIEILDPNGLAEDDEVFMRKLGAELEGDMDAELARKEQELKRKQEAALYTECARKASEVIDAEELAEALKPDRGSRIGCWIGCLFAGALILLILAKVIARHMQ